ncbi:hypothetical protein LXL04_029597 [Taraxacum kok-saghyz]
MAAIGGSTVEEGSRSGDKGGSIAEEIEPLAAAIMESVAAGRAPTKCFRRLSLKRGLEGGGVGMSRTTTEFGWRCWWMRDIDEEIKTYFCNKEKKHDGRNGNYGNKNNNGNFHKIKIPIFDRENDYGWVYHVEQYFEVHEIGEMYQSRVVSICMDELTLSWYRWNEVINSRCTWEGPKQKQSYGRNTQISTLRTMSGFGRGVMIRHLKESRSFENSYIPENPRTPKPLTFSKNRLRGAKNRSNISPVAKKIFRKNDFFFPKNFAYVQTFFLCICAQFFVLFQNRSKTRNFFKFFYRSLYNTYLKRFVKKNLKKNAKKKKLHICTKNKKKLHICKS